MFIFRFYNYYENKIGEYTTKISVCQLKYNYIYGYDFSVCKSLNKHIL